MDNLAMLVVVAGGLASLFAGLLCIGTAAYLFARKKSLSIGPVPVWMLALAAGLFLTFVIPGIAVFLIVQTIMAPQPVVTCYEVQPEVTCYKPAASAVAAVVPVAMRLELVEKLRESGRLPDHVYRKIRK